MLRAHTYISDHVAQGSRNLQGLWYRQFVLGKLRKNFKVFIKT